MRYQLLGPIELSGSDGPVRLGGPKQRAVLAALLLQANRVVPEGRLISLVWGDEAPASVRGQLQMYVSQLRKLIGESVILRRAPGYLIQVRSGELDLHAFDEAVAQARADLEAGRSDAAAELLRTALALWRGPALGGVTETFLASVGTGLEERRLSAQEEYFDVQLAAGRHAQVARELHQVAADNPLRERLQSLLMLALHRDGRTPDALEVYAATRSALVAEKGVEPGPLLRETQMRLLRNEDRVRPAPVTVPRQLPADLPQFAGRAAGLSRLDEALRPDGVPSVAVVAIGGGAGVGKSALAVHWAHQVRERFPDGQLYVNLRGFDPSGNLVTPDEAVSGFLDALDTSAERIPATAEARFSRYRSLLADKRVLIVLDNARDAEQVRPLLPGSPGCLTVVTSRNQLPSLVAVEGAHPVALDLPSEGEAREMLARRLAPGHLTAEPEAAEQISALCARLPLALAIVAARAATNPGFSLTALAGELRAARGSLDAFDTGDPATDVRAVFSWSYRTLGDAAARLFRFLGLHPGPHVTTSAAASLLGVPVRRARPLLAELTRAQLITEHSPGRYGFHDLLRAYATELTHTLDSEADRRDATHRMLDHYLHTATLAARLLRPERELLVPGESQAGVTVEALTDELAAGWFGAEHAVVRTTIELAAGAGFEVHAWQLACALTSTYWYGGARWLGEVSTYETALAAAGRLGDTRGLAYGHRGLATLYMTLDQFDEAHAELTRAVELFGEIGELVMQADSCMGLTVIYDRLRRNTELLQYSHRALELFRLAGHRFGEGGALNNVGWAHALLGDYELAVTYCKQALAILEEFGDRTAHANAWDSLGYANQHLGHHREAVTCYRQAIELYRHAGSRFYESRTLNRLGENHISSGEADAAREAWQRALDIRNELGLFDDDEIRGKLGRLGGYPGHPT